MQVTVYPSQIGGSATAPASKSHTIRALIFAAAADAQSVVYAPLVARDTTACMRAIRAMGAVVRTEGDPVHTLYIRGCGGGLLPATIDVENSGTTLRLGTALAATSPHSTTFTADAQTCTRPMEPLLASLRDLGAHATSNNGYAPLTIGGPLKGGETTIACPTSQYLSALLIAAPLAKEESHIHVTYLNEAPYIHLTLEWLDRMNINYRREGLTYFWVPGNQRYPAFKYNVAGDYSSATFILCAAAITGSKVTVDNLSAVDTQGDKGVLTILRDMGYTLGITSQHVTVDATSPRTTPPRTFDLNNMPDALPALAATACYASAPITFVNIAHTRIKESDRIDCIQMELGKMGAKTKSTADSLVVFPSALSGAAVQGHHDHRIVMALAIAALGAQGPTQISGAEDVAITYPHFFTTLRQLGAKIEGELGAPHD